LINELPVDNLPEFLNVVRTAVLEILVVSVLPDVNSEDGAEAVGLRHHSIGRVPDGELGSRRIVHEPGPARAEVGNTLGFEFRLELVNRAEGGGDGFLEGLGHGLAVGGQALPVEGVVEVLGGLVVENLLGVTALEGGVCDVFDGFSRFLGEGVELVDVGLVVLGVVEFDLARGEDGGDALLPVEVEFGEGGFGVLLEVGQGSEVAGGKAEGGS